jgi:DNA-directed RNA polymerase II subunit RPB2
LIDTDVVVHWQVLGLVKNLAVVAYIIVGSAVNPILGVKFLEEWSIENFEVLGISFN